MLQLSCIVLAGGRSERMGRDKRELRLGCKSFLELAVEKAGQIAGDVIVAVGDERQGEGVEGARKVVDEQRHRGPLFGLATALKACRRDYVAVLPVDAPLLNPGIYRLMAGEVERTRGLEAVVPLGPSGPEPLLALYKVKPFLKACERAIAEGGERAMDAVERLRQVRYLHADMFKAVDPELLSFRNINTPEDLRALLGGGVDEDG